MDINFWEITAVGIITLLAVISPGPDFAMITRLTLGGGRRAGLYGALGIACGNAVHLSYTLIGLGVLLAERVWVLTTLRYLGAGYLIWLGLAAFWPDLRAWVLGRPKPAEQTIEVGVSTTSPNRAFWLGFGTNALNPKTMLFIVAIFSQVISPTTPIVIELAYGLYIALCHLIWFALVAMLLSWAPLQSKMATAKTHIEKGVGLCLTAFGIKLLAG